jgi:hypothetical protein
MLMEWMNEYRLSSRVKTRTGYVYFEVILQNFNAYRIFLCIICWK